MKKLVVFLFVIFVLISSSCGNTVKHVSKRVFINPPASEYMVELNNNPLDSGGLMGRVAFGGVNTNIKPIGSSIYRDSYFKMKQFTRVTLYKKDGVSKVKSISTRFSKFYFKNILPGKYVVGIVSPFDNSEVKMYVRIYRGLDTGVGITLRGKNFRKNYSVEFKKRYPRNPLRPFLMGREWDPRPKVYKIFKKPVELMTFVEFKATVLSLDSLKKRRVMVNAYVAYHKKNNNIPIKESNSAIFLVDTKKENLIDEPIAIDVEGPIKALFRIKGTDLMFVKVKIANHLASAYRFLSAYKPFKDSFNVKGISLGGYGERSRIEMPLYKDAWVTAKRDFVPQGRVKTITNFQSKYVKSRNVSIYLPPSYGKSNKKYPVLYMHDGQTHLLGNFNVVLDNLIHWKKIPEIICVVINNLGDMRTYEYVPYKALLEFNRTLKNDKYKGLAKKYKDFVVKEVVPTIEGKFRIKKDKKYRAIAGQSFGGYASYYIGFNHPELFGKVGGQSGFWSDGYAKSPKLDQDLYFDVGSLSHDSNIRAKLDKDIPKIFKAKGYNLKVYQHNGSHTPMYWLPALQHMINFFWGKGK